MDLLPEICCRWCREIAGARDILQKFENLKKQREWNFNL
jgi:hypothetical protein